MPIHSLFTMNAFTGRLVLADRRRHLLNVHLERRLAGDVDHQSPPDAPSAPPLLPRAAHSPWFPGHRRSSSDAAPRNFEILGGPHLMLADLRGDVSVTILGPGSSRTAALSACCGLMMIWPCLRMNAKAVPSAPFFDPLPPARPPPWYCCSACSRAPSRSLDHLRQDRRGDRRQSARPQRHSC